MLRRLQCVSWRHPRDPVQIELFGTSWSAKELAECMNGWAWGGDASDLRIGLGQRVGREFEVDVLRNTRRDGDDIFMVWPKGTPEPQ